MQGIRRKIVYVTLYEAIAIAICTVGFALASGQGLGLASALSVICSLTAVLWNLVFNHAFERWEARQPVRGRNFKRRAAHALMFEGGLVLLLVPLIAWWLDVGLWHALVMDLGLVLFFLIYTFAFTWAFDKLFGLPTTATP
ncbi:membrane protein [Hylemonella gracilis str. Niagara R]|uniref:Membrane protein n=1 Tax=Hylemonella gracilis str. Niagara R TaxID=1458275 RepID=A0A016XCI9_9BURK|nr:PACE efflux transporter [Hylemonella gracilis]EYC49824.1 membrane protein [Hylemonella gracilis str. Niagara R]